MDSPGLSQHELQSLIMNLIAIRKKLHSIAETAHKERQTAAFIKKSLLDAGIEDIRDGIGGYGLIATIDSGNPGPVLLFRAELDALPIDETITLAHASQNPGIAHKCGHDGHMAILVGLAQSLQKKPPKRGKIHLLFQPAEETGEGAERMLADRKMSDIRPDFAFALHNLPGYPKHSVLLREGVFAAGSAGLILRLTGNTSHAAHPEQGKSPAAAVASLIRQLPGLPQKILPAGRHGLITIIHVRIGNPAFGTTPGQAVLMATLRAWEPQDLDRLRDRAVEIARKTAGGHKLEMDFEWTEVFYPTMNHPEAVNLVREAAKKLEKRQNPGETITLPDPFSWSEDFGHFTEKFPGALFGLGAGSGHAHLHDTRYDFPDDLLETGVALFSGIIEETGLF